MQHPWLKTFNWKELLSEKMPAPFIPPESADNFDEQHANHERTLNQTEQEEIYNKKLLLRRDSIKHLFNGYYFDYLQEVKDKKKYETATLAADKSTLNSSRAPAISSNVQTSKNFITVISQQAAQSVDRKKEKPLAKKEIF